MRLGIDASNIRGGGGVTHLIELLTAADPPSYGFDRVTVWAGRRTLDRLPNRPWLDHSHHPLLDKPLPARLLWQSFKLPHQLYECDLLFVPGGTYTGTFHPFVTMSQNLLPFDVRERARFGLSLTRFRFHLLELVQASTFRRADGMIFLTEKARELVEGRMKPLRGMVVTIPHGVSDEFRRLPRPTRSLAECSSDNPFRWLYVSIVTVYKHQWHVAEAVAALRSKGLPVTLDLIGPSTTQGLQRLRATLGRLDPASEFIRYQGSVPYDELATYYHRADAFAFASSCETFGQILLEAMSAGLPIACSDRGPMPEILGDAGIYFNPEQSDNIANAMYKFMVEPELQAYCAWSAYERAKQYSWERCARETFSFLTDVTKISGLANPIVCDNEQTLSK